MSDLPTPTVETTQQDALLQELKGLRQDIRVLSQTQVSSATMAPAHVSSKLAVQDPAEEGSTRLVTSLALAAVGFKLMMLVGAKVGLLVAILSGAKKPALAVEKKDLDDALNISSLMDNPWVKYPTIGGGIGSAVGVLGGAILGYKRGDRIKDANQLWKEPFKSLGLLLANKPPQQISNIGENVPSQTAVHNTPTASSAPLESQTKAWREIELSRSLSSQQSLIR